MKLNDFVSRSTDHAEDCPCLWFDNQAEQATKLYTSIFGLSWQIVAPVLGGMLQEQDAKKTERVMQALLHRKKIDINQLSKAYEQ